MTYLPMHALINIYILCMLRLERISMLGTDKCLLERIGTLRADNAAFRTDS